MSRFLDALQSGQVLLMDGAMGTELQRAGLAKGECGEFWNLSRPDEIRKIHQAYIDAGARCLLTNTFQSNPQALARHGHADLLEAINHAAVDLARTAAGQDRFVLADIGPPEDGWNGSLLDQVLRSFRGVDAILLETFSDLNALWLTRYACLPALETDDVPVLLSITYRKTDDGLLTSAGGHPPDVYAQLARQYGVSALGVNCGREIGMNDILQIIRRYRLATDLPLFARPNAGTPAESKAGWIYPLSPTEMATHVDNLLEAGISMIGGCCGTTPDHIATLNPRIASWNARREVADCGL